MAIQPTIYPIPLDAPGRLFVMPRPTALILHDEMAWLGDNRVGVVLSMLGEEEAHELGLAEEGSACTRAGIRFHHFPITDWGLPDRDSFTQTVHRVADYLREGESVAAHCRAGVGRSGMLATCVLQCFGHTAEDALAIVSHARGLRVPDTPAQRAFVEAFHSETRG